MTKKHIKTRGIILGSKALGEADKLVFIYTRDHGKIKAIAKGALKPTSRFMGTTETLNLCNFELYNGPKRTLITDLELEENYKEIHKNFGKITKALLITKITDELTLEDTNSSEIFDLINNSLQELKRTKDKTLVITFAFFVKLLDILGLLPDLKNFESFHTKLEKKYKKLLNFLKKESFSKIKKIKLTKKEESQIKSLLKNLIENEIDKKLRILL